MWNVNVGDATTAGSLYYLLPDYSTRHQSDRLEAFADAVAQTGELKDRVEQVRAQGWSGWPSLPLARAAAMAEEALLPFKVAIG